MQHLIKQIDWQKVNHLIPTIIQDNKTSQVLMLGYMNKEALKKTLDEKKVFFYSRTKQRIWMKGESSGNKLELIDIHLDCDNDTLLIQVLPKGPTCHTGDYSCFHSDTSFSLYHFEQILQDRIVKRPKDSYTSKLIGDGIERIAQKLGEEATETIVAALAEKHKFADETADLLYHLILLMNVLEFSLSDIERILKSRHNQGKKAE